MRNVSKLLSLVLRHKPETLGLNLDPCGWVEVDALLEALAKDGQALSREQLQNLVKNNDKKRFTFSTDGLRIRAVQGHSVPVELGLESSQPQKALFHGTAERFVESILNEGLKNMERQFVHLSADKATALAVGGRHGNPVIFQVNAQGMEADGSQFFRAENGVWLVEKVAPMYLKQVYP